MSFDGILVHALTAELNSALLDTRLVKIQEPSNDELLLTFKSRSGEARLLLSASASLPFFCLTESRKESPMEAPAFLMLLRKHLSNARFVRAEQPGLERVLFLYFEHLDEMGDLKTVRLVSEVMGKYSNLILVSEDGTILDAIRRVSPLMSSVRSVLPGKPYFIPETQGKTDPLEESRADFTRRLDPERTALQNIVDHYQGMSNASVSECLLGHGIHPDELPDPERLWDAFSALCETIREERFSPLLVRKNEKPEAFSVLPFHSYTPEDGYLTEDFHSASSLVDFWYRDRNRTDVLKEDRRELLKAVKNAEKREAKKLEIHKKQLADSENAKTDRLYGELLTAFAYMLPQGEPEVTCLNFYDENRPVTIPVDPDFSIQDNAQRYFARYQKAKRTREAALVQKEEAETKLAYLESVALSIGFAKDAKDLREIRRELQEEGLLRPDGNAASKKKPAKKTVSAPYRFRTSDGFTVLVGRNNTQNDEITFRIAKKQDIFFHVKKAPGSHVVLLTEGMKVPDRSYEEAARLAAHFSSKASDDRAEVDYVLQKEVRKPNGAKPGFVVYYTNYSMVVPTDIRGIESEQ